MATLKTKWPQVFLSVVDPGKEFWSVLDPTLQYQDYYYIAKCFYSNEIKPYLFIEQ